MNTTHSLFYAVFLRRATRLAKGLIFSELLFLAFFTSSLYGQSFTPKSLGLISADRALVAWGDYDRDGDLDVFLAGRTLAASVVSRVYRNDGDTLTLTASLTGVNRSAFGASVAWGDYDNDGDLDLLLAGRDAGSIKTTKLYRNNAGNFIEIQTTLAGIDEGTVAWGDYDNDGDLDILLAGDSSPNKVTKIYRNDGRDRFIDTNAELKPLQDTAVAWGDYDNDGDLDIAAIGNEGSSSNRIRFAALYRNENGRFVDAQAGLLPARDGFIVWGDYDDDGDLDLALGGDALTTGIDTTIIYRNDGGNFVNAEVRLPGVDDGSFAWGDYDNDGDLDILLVGNQDAGDRIARIYRNENGIFNDSQIPLEGVSDASIAWGDYDSDGDLDILLAGDTEGDRTTLIYRNELDKKNSLPNAPANLISRVTGNVVTFSWDQAGDSETRAAALTYNLRVGNTPGGSQIVSAMADSLNGYRYVPRLGNTNHRTSWTIRDLPVGVYYWSVQAIDNAFAGSALAPETTFVINKPLAPQNLAAIAAGQQVTLRWNSSSEPGLARYRIYAGASPNPSTPIDSTDTGQDTTITISGLDRGQTYYFRITAVRAGFIESDFSNEVTATPGLFSSLAGTIITAALTEVENGAVVWGDFDRDNDLDLLLAGDSEANPAAKVFSNNPDRFRDIGALLERVKDAAALWGDYDNDGDLDILLAGTDDIENPLAEIYRNNAGKFVDIDAGLLEVTNPTATWGDYDNDGDLDLLLAGHAGVSGDTTIVYRNNNGRFVNIAAPLLNLAAASAWGDYDNDGDLDILLAGSSRTGQPAIRIYRNDQGNFTSLGSAGLTAIRHGSVVWGDFDQDGRLDILLAGETVTPDPVTQIYHNDGGGKFTISASLRGVSRAAAAVGDYDNDGDLDILLAGNSNLGPLATIYRNDGGSFEDLNPGLQGVANSAIAFGDYDNDGKLDIIIAGHLASGQKSAVVYHNEIATANTAPSTPENLNAQVFRNNVTISWDAATDNETAAKALTYNIRVGTAPGGNDVVSAMANPQTAYRQIPQPGNANHNLRWTIKRLAGGTYYWSVQAIDNAFTGSAFATEGSFSIIVPAAPKNLVALAGNTDTELRWNRHPSEQIRGYRIYSGTAPSAATLVDSTSSVNDTTKTIFGLLNGVAYYFRITAVDTAFLESGFSNEDNATPALFTLVPARLEGQDEGEAIWGDYDNDGDLDLLIAGENTSFIRLSLIYRNNGSSNFTLAAELEGSYTSAADWGDYDNDGDLDIVLTGEDRTGGKFAKIYRNENNGAFSDINAALIGVDNGDVAWGDYDNDGDLDIALTGTSSGQGEVTKLYRNEGGGIFTDILAPLVGLGVSAVAWGDYDKDADLDLLVAGQGSAESKVTKLYRNDGGRFIDTQAAIAGVDEGSVAWGDYDNDGSLDILLTGTDAARQDLAKVYRNDGGNFTDINAPLEGVDLSAAVWGDYDSDGDLDIVLAGDNTAGRDIARVYENAGGIFKLAPIALPQTDHSMLAWGDYDNDNDLDILLAGRGVGNVFISRIYRNNFGGTNTAPNVPTNLSSAVSGNAVTLSWDKSTDNQTAARGLSYNLRIGKTLGGFEIVSPMAAPANGLRLVPRLGNTNQNNRWIIQNLPPGQYFWSVQTIDHAFAGSAFAPEQTFTVGMAALAFGEPALNFGDLTVNTGGELLVKLSNVGSQALTVNRISIRGADSLAFKYDGPQSFNLNAHESLVLSVRFAPASAGKKIANLSATANVGLSAIVNLAGNAVSAPTPFLASNKLLLDFGEVFIRVDKADTIVLVNTGTKDLNVTSIELAGADKENFSFNSSTAFAIRAGNRSTIPVIFRPSVQKNQPEEKTAQIFIQHDAASLPRVISLRGNAVPTVVDLSATALNFDEINFGNSRQNDIIVTNRGNASLRVTRLDLGGQDVASFAVIANPATMQPIAPNESRTIAVEFSPKTLGNKIARLQISFDLLFEQMRPLTLLGKGVDNEAPKISDPQSNKLIVAQQNDSLVVSAKITDNVRVRQISLVSRAGGQKQSASTNTIPMDLIDAGSARYQAIIRGADLSARGIEFKVVATDSLVEGLARSAETAWQAVQVRLAEGKLEHTQLGADTPQAYRLISLPLALNNSTVDAALLKFLGSPDIKQWRLWGIDPQNAKSLFPYIEYPNPAASDLAAGKALFLITRNTTTFNNGPGITVKTLQAGNPQPFKISLKPGWNMIGSPFNFRIPIANLRIPDVQPERVRNNLYEFENGFKAEPPTELRPWQGYLFKATDAADSILLIDPSEDVIARQNLARSNAAPDWMIFINATCANAQDFYNHVGVAQDADIAWDLYERFEPPPIGDFVMVAFPHEDWKKYPDFYTTDFQPPSTAGHVWEFTVQTNLRGQPVTLQFENLETVPENFEIHLLDLNLQLMQNLREERQYVFGASRNDDMKKFRLLAGTPAFIQQHSSEALGIPTTHQLSQNFPNPFNPATTIRYGLPKAERVTLKIYNLLGEEVATLVDNAEKKAGYHAAIWDGRNRDGGFIASGIYLYRLRAGKSVVTKKMALVK